jgi:ankyrin repeat protein
MGRDDLVQLLDQYAPRLPTADGSLGQLVARFLTNACPDHHVRGGWSHAVASDTAARMLEQNQEIARFDIYTAVVCGDIDEVRRILARDPDQARAKGGPKGSYSVAGEKFIVEPTATTVPFWEPLLYLCFTRLPTRAANENAVDIARLLLDHGADPNSYFMAGDSRYSPLTGVIGEGEESRKGHPRRDELTRLLLERGANPYDVQVFYNIHFQGNVLWYLELAYEYSLKNGRAADWKDPQWSMIDMGGYGLGARYLLTIAVNHDDTALAEWVLEHGADPNAELPAHSKLSKESLYDQAVRRGHLGVASLLARYGATAGKAQIDDEERFVAAALRGDGAELERLAIAHPELLRSTRALFAAAEKDRADVVAMLLDLGTSVDVQDNEGQRALHVAAYADAVRVVQLLIDRGAEVDPVEKNWGNTPLDSAIWGQHTRTIEVLGRYSSNVWALTFTGQVERLREVIAKNPARAKASYEGTTLLMYLPGDETRALAIAQLLLEHGADPTSRAKDGLTAAEMAEKRGMPEVARLLRS